MEIPASSVLNMFLHPTADFISFATSPTPASKLIYSLVLNTLFLTLPSGFPCVKLYPWKSAGALLLRRLFLHTENG